MFSLIYEIAQIDGSANYDAVCMRGQWRSDVDTSLANAVVLFLLNIPAIHLGASLNTKTGLSYTGIHLDDVNSAPYKNRANEC